MRKYGFYNGFYTFVCFGFLLFRTVDSVCSWPSPFGSSVWRDSGKGEIVFQVSSMSGWSINTVDTSTTQSDWQCLLADTFSTDGRLIMITSSPFLLFGTNYYAYLCITLTKITDHSYRYYINHEVQAVFHDQRLFVYTVNTVSDVDVICNDAFGATGPEYQLLIRSGSEAQAKIDCPWSFLGRFRYTYTDTSGTQTCDINTSEVTTCTVNTDMTFNYTACSTQVAYSVSNTVWCVSNIQESGVNFVTVYNGNDADSDIDSVNTFRFTCFAIDANVTQASISPRHCQRDQGPQHLPATNDGTVVGSLLEFSDPLETCPTCPELSDLDRGNVTITTSDTVTIASYISTCPVLSDPDRGNVTITTLDTVTTASYVCDTPFTLIGATSRTCQTDDTWSGSDPFCSCAIPTSPSNGGVITNINGTIATYTCDTGYSINGTSTRICNLTTSDFSGTDPTCVQCANIPTVTGRQYTFSRISSGTVTLAMFTCSSGYTLSGSSSLTCQSDGTWNDNLPVCVVCDVLTNPSSGIVSLSTTGTVTTASYTCATFYTLIGAQTRTCQIDGSWDGSQPICQCNAPTSPANGNVVSDGTTATYTCSVNYTLNGDATRTCGADGSWWSGSDPTCASCLTVSVVTGGSVTLSTTGTVTTAKYTCDLGYSLDGSSTITCQPSGSWSSALSTCAECPTLADPASGTVTITTSGTKTSATYACASGYDLNGNTIRLCDSNGDWSLSAPTCTCQAPPILASGTMNNDGVTVTYTCDVGFSLNGVRSRTCGTDGSGWSDSDPSCSMCQSMYTPSGGTAQFSTDSYNTQVSFTCDVGYTLNGVTPITCLNDGSWNATQPSCAKCPDLSNPSSGGVSLSTNTITTVATFSCATGYYLSGAFQLTCQSNATWSDTDPMCKCNFPSTPSNGAVSVSDSSTGTEATYTCNEGYTLSGLSKRECLTDGTGWEGSDPSCVVCGALSLITFGSFTLSTNNTHTSVTFQCNVGTTLNGNSEAACMDDGTWSNPQPTCVTCPNLSDPDSGTVTLTTTGLVTMATYSCATGYSLTSSGSLQCQTSGTWDISPPTCVCDSVSAVLNGQFNISTDHSVASFSCDTGYVLVGSMVRYCQTDGSGWNGTQPTCDATATIAPSTEGGDSVLSLHIAIVIALVIMVVLGIILFVGAMYKYFALRKEVKISSKPKDQCPVLTNPVGGSITLEGDGLTTTANYTCSAGYTLSGQGFLTCLQDASWDLDIPSCVQCQSLNTLSSVLVTMETDGHVTTAIFSCVSGYSKVGPDERSCLPDGTWNSSTPDCVCNNPAVIQYGAVIADGHTANYTCSLGSTLSGTQIITLCNNPAVIQNGAVIADGHTANYTCSLGSTLSGTQIRTCMNDGSGWSGVDPSCVVCPTLVSPVGGEVTTFTSGIVTSATYTCDSGYSLAGQQNINCQISGLWETLPTCVECDHIQAPESGNVSIATSGTVSTASYTCSVGYNLNGVSTRTCLSNGTWTSLAPTCSCQSPSSPANGQVVDDGQTATYSCVVGYSLNGSSVVTCSTNGTGWNGMPPICVECSPVPDVNGSSSTLTTDGLQTTLSYTCDVGYTLDGVHFMTCDSDGVWNSTEPECVACPSLLDPGSGNVTITTDGYTSTATFICAPGYYVEGTSSFQCQTSGQWAGTSPACKCNLPPKPADGIVVVTDTVNGQVANYTCNTGYTLFGLSSRLCLSDGTGWEGEDPTCSSCTLPSTQSELSTVLSTNGVVTMVTYTCAQNFSLSGTSTQVCQSDGTWSDDVPSCTLCSPFSTISGGNLSVTTGGLMTTVSYTCDVGSTLNGSKSISCLSNGDWNGTEPTCVSCPVLSDPASGSVSITTDGYVTMATFTCVSGYYLSGQSSLSCLTTGLWDGDPPSCECNFPISPINGDVSVKDTNAGTIAEYSCNTNYTLSGPVTRVCQTNGSGWTGTEPSCVSCPMTQTQAGMSVVISSNGTLTTATYTCDQNYTLDGNSILECRSDGTWSDSEPTCTKCSAVTAPSGGSVIKQTNGLVTSATFSCDTGYSLNGSASLVCLSDGSWNDTQPNCVSCPALSNLTNGAISTSTDGYQNTATFACVSGYYLSGPASISCLSTGQWNEEQPTCECDFPLSPTNGDVSVKDTDSGTVAEYTCSTNYTLNGSQTRTCQTDGSGWTGDDPKCVLCSAIQPTLPLSALLSTSGTVTTVTFTCGVNYTLIGTYVQTCFTDGSWSHIIPTCEPCESKSLIDSGSISFTSNGTVTKAQFICDSGYSLNSTSTSICLSNGSWDQPDPVCLCDPPNAPSNGAMYISSDGRYVNYSCASEYMLVGSAERYCLRNGSGWNGTQPSCELTVSPPAASTEDSSIFPIHIALFIVLLIAIVVLLVVVAFCAYRRFKQDKHKSKIGTSTDNNADLADRKTSFGSDKISKDVENGNAFVTSKTSGKKLSFDVRNLTPTPPNEVPNVKFDSDRPTKIIIRKEAAMKPPTLPPRSTQPQSNVPLSSVRLPKLKSRPPTGQEINKTKRRKKKRAPAKESLLSESSGSSTPIDITLRRETTLDLLSTAEFDYIQPVYCHEAQTPGSSRPSTSKSRPSTAKSKRTISSVKLKTED